MQAFKQIKAWQRARVLGVAIHNGTSHFARRDASYLRSQLTRAVKSIAANIVEGCGAATNKEFARYLDVAIKSANETEHHLLDALDQGLISEETWRRWTSEVVEIRKMIFAYRKKVLENDRLADEAKHPSRASTRTPDSSPHAASPSHPKPDASSLVPGPRGTGRDADSPEDA